MTTLSKRKNITYLFLLKKEKVLKYSYTYIPQTLGSRLDIESRLRLTYVFTLKALAWVLLVKLGEPLLIRDTHCIVFRNNSLRICYDCRSYE